MDFGKKKLEYVLDIGGIYIAKVLNDYGMTHSFANPRFMSGIDVRPIKLSYDLEVKTLIGDQSLIANWVDKYGLESVSC